MNRHRKITLIVAATAAMMVTGVAAAGAQSTDGPMAWAYPLNPPGFAVTPDDGRGLHVPDSTLTYTIPEVRNIFNAPDWHPEEHPPLPDVVRFGRAPEVRACAYCHRATGPGGAENASITGLPEPYIIQQFADYKSGARNGSVTPRAPLTLMMATAKDATDAEVAAAAAYFSSLTPQKLYTVVETDTAPKTHVYVWAHLKDPSGEMEPLGRRIVEVPVDSEQFEARDARAEFMVYAPVGSLAKGEDIVTTGGGKTTACAVCHGPTLTGLGPYIPPIAGRSPSYLFRQLYDFQVGVRAGPWSPLMAGVVANLTQDDMLNVVAYLASLTP